MKIKRYYEYLSERSGYECITFKNLEKILDNALNGEDDIIRDIIEYAYIYKLSDECISIAYIRNILNKVIVDDIKINNIMNEIIKLKEPE